MFQFITMILLTTNLASADYLPGDGTLDFTCHQADKEAKPHHIFIFQLLYNAQIAQEMGLELLSDENLASGNGSVVYQISTVQSAFLGAEGLYNPQIVQGCNLAPIQMSQNQETGSFDLYFECDGDGDAGFGEIKIAADFDQVTGTITFPEGQGDLLYPISEDASIPFQCEMN